MLHLTSGYGLLVEYGLAAFVFVDIALTPEPAAKFVPRWGWALFVLIFPLCGAILWLVAGRTWRATVRARLAGAVTALSEVEGQVAAAVDRPPAEVIEPRSDVRGTALVDELAALNEEHERTLQLWEADLRRREAALRERLDSAA